VTVFANSAVAYAQNEGLYVFPLSPRGKTPLTTHGLDDATVDVLTIEAWWDRWPDANVAIRTGDLVVIDEDRIGALAELAESAGERMPETRISRTGKGRHYYFTQPAGQRVRNTAGKLAQGIDTRGDGGYVVAPPSVHPDGGTYIWESTAEPAPLPAWIASRLAKPEPTRTAPPTIPDSSTPYGQRALEAEIHAVATAPEGTRNHRLNQAAFALGQLVAGGEVDDHDARMSLAAAARACGLPDREATTTIASGLNSGLVEPRSAPKTERSPLRAVPTTPAVVEDDAGPQSRIQIEDWQTFNRNSQAELEFLISDLWPAKTLAFIASPPKKGKTWLGLSAAVSIATGTRFVASFDVATPRRVLYLALEGARNALRARIGCLARGLNLDPDSSDLENLHIAYRPRGINLADPTWAAEIANLAAEGYALIVVDVLRNAARIKEGDASEFSHLRNLLEPALAHTSIALLHHFTKLSELSKERTPAERMSGSGAMYGALDVGLFITGSDDHGRRLRVDFDGRDIAMPDPLSIYLEGGGRGPNGSLTYTDRAFWRGDIDEVAEDDVAVPSSAAVLDALADLGGYAKRADLVAQVKADAGDAFGDRTFERRLANLLDKDLIARPRYGFYAFPGTLESPPPANSAMSEWNSKPEDSAQPSQKKSDTANSATSDVGVPNLAQPSGLEPLRHSATPYGDSSAVADSPNGASSDPDDDIPL
jgi:hypothetical protein